MDYHIEHKVCLKTSDDMDRHCPDKIKFSTIARKNYHVDNQVCRKVDHRVLTERQSHIMDNYEELPINQQQVDEIRQVVTFQDSVENQPTLSNDTITNLAPLPKQTACGKNVWVLYAKSNVSETKVPIRVIIEDEVRKMHLFDFIRALTGCTNDNLVKEWSTIEKSLGDDILTKIRMSKFRFPELDRLRLTRSDSMAVDIYQAAKVALAIGKRAKWFTEVLVSLGVRYMGGDLTLADDIEYMHEAQQMMSEVEPDNFLRLWGEEFLHNSKVAEELQNIANPEKIVEGMAPETTEALEEEDITLENISEENRTTQRRYRSVSRSRERKTGKSLYLYPFIPVYKTRSEAIRCVSVPISHEISPSVVLCQEDLDGKMLVKVGRTKYTMNTRQKQYANPISDELYRLDHVNGCEFKLESGDLEQAESYILTKIRNANCDQTTGSLEVVGLVRNDGIISWKNEVIRIDNFSDTKELMEKSIDEYQIGLPYIKSESLTTEDVRLKEIELEKMQLEAKLKFLEILHERGASVEELTKVYFN